jgi:lysophospholipase L1-like esterase
MHKKHFFWLMPSLIFLLSAFCIEVYLRAQETQIINAKQSGLFLLESNPEFLIQHTPKGKRLIPGAQVLIKNHNLGHRDIPIRINSLGFRGEEIPSTKENEFRILLLGDSITWGDYLFEDELFHSSLSGLKHPQDKKIRIINAGVGDIGIEEMVDIYLEQYEAVQPDLVILNLYLNDARPPWGFPQEIAQRGWLRKNIRLAEFIYKRIRLYSWIEEKGAERFAWTALQSTLNWKENQKDFQTLVDAAQYDWGAGWSPSSIKVITPLVERIKEHTLQQDTPLAITILPVAYQVHAEFLNDTPQQLLKKMAQTLKIPALDFLPSLRIHKAKKLYYDQCHPTPEGNAFMATVLNPFVEELIKEQTNPH